MKGIKTTEFGSRQYKGVTIHWDEDHDKRIFKFIDGLSKKCRSSLVAVQESKACLYLIVSGEFSLKENEYIEVDDDTWFIAELTEIKGPCKWGSYNKYLKSKEWKSVKDDYHVFSDIASDVCFLCFEKDSLQLHHWRYPKNWNNDSYKNLMQVCSECHEGIHSIENSKLLHNSDTFKDNSSLSFIMYLSWIIKATEVMDMVKLERLSNEF